MDLLKSGHQLAVPRLNFGIDKILQSTREIEDKIHVLPHVTGAEKLTNAHVPLVTFPQAHLPHPANNHISHFYGQRQPIRPSAASFPFDFWPHMPTADTFFAGNIGNGYCETTSSGYLPSIVQRVPLAISFRTNVKMADMSPRTSSVTASSPALPSRARQGKRKKTWTRAVFSSLQRKGLERSFGAQHYICKKDRRKLAATLGLTDSQVRIWYANRRMKDKKSPRSESDN